MSIESDVYDFLKEKMDAVNADAEETHPLYGAELLADEFEEIKKESGVCIGRCVARIAPSRGVAVVKHANAELVLICYRRVPRADRQKRGAIRDLAIGMAEAAAMFFYKSPTLGGRQDGSLPLEIPRAADNTDATPYMVANLVVVINPTGAIDFTRRR